MVRKHQRSGEGHPLFWLLLGFLCGVMATLGVLLIWGGKIVGDEVAVGTPPAAIAAPPSAPTPAVTAPAKNAVRTPAEVKPPPAPSPSLAPSPPNRSATDQMAEDAAASGMTTRIR